MELLNLIMLSIHVLVIIMLINLGFDETFHHVIQESFYLIMC